MVFSARNKIADSGLDREHLSVSELVAMAKLPKKSSKKSPKDPAETKFPPELVSLRFLAMALGNSYGSIAGQVTRLGVRLGAGRTRVWADAVKKLPGKFADEESLRHLAKHVDVGKAGSEPIEVPGEILEMMKRAWKKIGAPGCPMLVTAEPVDEIPEDLPTNVKLDRVRLATQEEHLRFKKLQSERLTGMMCDRKSVEAEVRQIALKTQRFMRTIPAKVTGHLVKLTSLTDDVLREIQQAFDEEIVAFIREFQKDAMEIPVNAMRVAATKRYGERDAP
jgi:hypothetical protein